MLLSKILLIYLVGIALNIYSLKLLKLLASVEGNKLIEDKITLKDLVIITGFVASSFVGAITIFLTLIIEYGDEIIIFDFTDNKEG